MVVVQVQDRDPRRAAAGEPLGDDGRVVEEAVAAVHLARGMVARRPAEGVGRRRAAQDEVRGGERRVHRDAGGRVGTGDHGRRGVEAVGAQARGAGRASAGVAAGRVGPHEEGVRDEGSGAVRGAGGDGIGPGMLEQIDQRRVVQREDGLEPVLAGLDGPADPRVGQGRLDGGDPPRALPAGNGTAGHDLDQAVVGEVGRGGDDREVRQAVGSRPHRAVHARSVLTLLVPALTAYTLPGPSWRVRLPGLRLCGRCPTPR